MIAPRKVIAIVRMTNHGRRPGAHRNADLGRRPNHGRRARRARRPRRLARRRGPRADRAAHPGARPAPARLVVPGFQDCHVHAPPAGRERLTIDLHDMAAAGRPTSTRSPATSRPTPTPSGSPAAAGRSSTSRGRAAPRGSRRGHRRPSGVPVQPRRPRRVGELAPRWNGPASTRRRPTRPTAATSATTTARRAACCTKARPTRSATGGCPSRRARSGRHAILLRPAALLLARHHRLAGRLGHAGDLRRVPLARLRPDG